MSVRRKAVFALLLLLFPVALSSQAPPATIILAKPEEFQAAFASVPCKEKERLPAVKELFLQMGAAETDIALEQAQGTTNFVLKLAGQTEEKIIVGAHYDFAGAGSCGAVDNWTGIVTIAQLYRSLKNAQLKKTILFVGFDKEEQGLLGSKAMANKIKKEELRQYCAVVNIDSLGLNTPQVLRNVSSPKLEAAAAALSKQMKIGYQAFEMATALADSAPFLAKNIPAVTISAIPQDWTQVLHHAADQKQKINPISVYLGYRLALALVAQINDNDCGAYR